MKIPILLALLPLLMPASVFAGTVLYTDTYHPPMNTDASVSVIYLDGPEQLQAQLFGELSSNPDDAQRQAQAVLQSPQWQTHEQALATVYRAVVRAWELGVKKSLRSCLTIKRWCMARLTSLGPRHCAPRHREGSDMQRPPLYGTSAGQPRLTCKSFGVVMILSAAGVPAASAALNSAQIVASAVSQSCISWRVSGICYWLLCTPFGCRVVTSMKVTHFIPEAVVSAYNTPGSNPWREMSLVSQVAGGLENAVTGALGGVSAGGGNNGSQDPRAA